ncbi:MAG: nucleotide sugar dehydrogenase [bacterium]|nr:nucleotide sugar dehydrogenase [bacterium]
MGELEVLEQRIEAGTCLVGVIGLGYVGLPLALAFAEQGIRVLGFDVDEDKIAALASHQTYIDYISAERIAGASDDGLLAATSDFGRLAEPDALLICVPTPLTQHQAPDLSYVLKTAEAIRQAIRPGQIVILESTTYPGTTDVELRGVLEQSGLRCDEDFLLAFSPEREDPGNPDYSTPKIPKVVGGVGERSGRVAAKLYAKIVPEPIVVSSSRVAEATKLTENIFRAVNIALVNELKVLFGAMEIDVREVLDAAATKPFGFMRFDPGPGWGGHCIPVDPYYLAWKAREYGLSARFIELAGTVNVEMPRWVVDKLQRALNDRGRSVRGSRILVLGLAYKPNVADPRESPAFEILSQLHELGADYSYHDPLIPVAPPMRSWPELPALESSPLTAEILASQDAVVLVTDHAAVDYDLVLEHGPLVVDTRGVYRQAHEKVIKA